MAVDVVESAGGIQRGSEQGPGGILRRRVWCRSWDCWLIWCPVACTPTPFLLRLSFQSLGPLLRLLRGVDEARSGVSCGMGRRVVRALGVVRNGGGGSPAPRGSEVSSTFTIFDYSLRQVTPGVYGIGHRCQVMVM